MDHDPCYDMACHICYPLPPGRIVVGLGPDMPSITNSTGGKQSDTPYALNLIPALAVLEESKVLKHGADKYGVENWIKIPIEDHLNHALQHIYAYLAGDRSDNHLANLSCRSHFALELQERKKREKPYNQYQAAQELIPKK